MDAPSVKQCGVCGQDKPVEEFTADRRARDGRRGYCRPCANASAREYRERNAAELSRRRATPEARRKIRHAHRRHYIGSDVSLAEVEALAESQGHRCAICGRHEADLPQSLHLDHDHQTGRIRAFLCGSCNGALGLFRDNPDLLRAAATYLETHREVHP